MKKFTKFLSVFLGVGMIFGGLTAAKLIKEKETSIQAEADVAVNDTFYYIYNDAYNNSAFNESFKQTLLVFSGTPHGYTEDVVIPAADLGSNILIDGQPLANYAGSIVLPWNNQNWIRIVYPNTAVSEGSTLELVEGTTVGDSVYGGCKFKLNASGLWRQVFDGAVNATFNSIYPNAAYNCATELLIVYNGTALPAGIAYHGDRLLHFENYLGYNNGSFVNLSGAQMLSWASSAQKWLDLRFPAASAGDKLIIEEGLTIDTVVFEKMVFQFNGTEWSRLNLIDDDPLVKNSDYKLFTFGDYRFDSNASFIRYAPSENIDALENSFGLRFIVNIPDGQLTSMADLKIGCSDIYGSNPLYKVTLDYDTNVYLTFNGAIDWSTSKTLAWDTDVDHLVEFYAIRTSETAVTCLLGVDEQLIWKSASQSLEGLTIRKFLTVTGTANTYTYYSDAPDTTAKALNRFNKMKLHSEDIAYTDNTDTGACRGETGYYAKAKAFYNTFLTVNQAKEFATGASYADARARLVAWAAANGETLSFNASTGALVIAAHAPLAIVDNKNTAAIILCIVVMSLSLGVAAIWFFRKRKIAK